MLDYYLFGRRLKNRAAVLKSKIMGDSKVAQRRRWPRTLVSDLRVGLVGTAAGQRRTRCASVKSTRVFAVD